MIDSDEYALGFGEDAVSIEAASSGVDSATLLFVYPGFEAKVGVEGCWLSIADGQLGGRSRDSLHEVRHREQFVVDPRNYGTVNQARRSLRGATEARTTDDPVLLVAKLEGGAKRG